MSDEDPKRKELENELVEVHSLYMTSLRSGLFQEAQVFASTMQMKALALIQYDISNLARRMGALESVVAEIYAMVDENESD